MITYFVTGRIPSALPASVFRRMSRVSRGIRGLSGKKAVGVRFVSAKDIQLLNRTYRGKNRPTDVLSFETGTESELGDLAICPAVAVREAKRRKIDPAEELVRLLVHGTLHLAGVDHATVKDEEKMFRIQEKIVETVMS